MRTRTSIIVVALLAVILVVVATELLLHHAAANTGVRPPGSAAGDRRQVNLLALADWGDDTRAQRCVADAMGDYVAVTRIPLDAVLLLGDNFYGDLAGTADRRWTSTFERMFDPRRLNVPFYAVLGNHDYDRDKDLVELGYARQCAQSRWEMPGRWYRVDLPADQPLVRLLMLDSNRAQLGDEQFEAQTRWLSAELSKPTTAIWTIVGAHRPLYSNGRHGDDPVLQERWGPLLRDHGVDFYLAGHDHNLQHLEIAGLRTAFIVTGGGGAKAYDVTRSSRGPFASPTHGFVHLRLGKESADVLFLDESGRPVHAFTRWPQSLLNNVR